ncbi:hypothetical protein B1C78_10155 [Thioalkalivibrio denitrificans]|uniref:Uncharacterized protein n=1 Tax=Thioalkalivibrio denitrificans TaxID=108003 RepID=A0A1V3NFN2_9GAMM|nr:hypothetical protein [Thioalkalivibrio denitrificans]OOG23881.1 hypothetical protein B1C78_10155 [Thioalkalivibrio denitrificans]
MKVTERFEMGKPLRREPSMLRADTYNRARLLLSESGQEALFVPIRPMQYLAVIQAGEFVFVDGLGPRVVQFIWHRFRTGERQALTDPVAFELVCFRPDAGEIVQRLHVELSRALALQASRRRRPAPTGTVLPFRRQPVSDR